MANSAIAQGVQRVSMILEAERLDKKLRRPHTMSEVFFQLRARRMTRDGYHYVAPWSMFQGTPDTTYQRIKDVVDHV